MAVYELPDLYSLALGGAVLGGGGGGALRSAWEAIGDLSVHARCAMHQPGAHPAPPFRTAAADFLGRAADYSEDYTGRDILLAVEAALNRFEGSDGAGPTDTLLAARQGALSLVLPMAVAGETGRRVVDGDAAGRSVPRLRMTALALADLVPDPAVLATPQLGTATLGLGTPKRFERGANALRESVFDGAAGLVAWPLTRETAVTEAVAAPGSVSRAWRVGKALEGSRDPLSALLEVLNGEGLPARVLASGRGRPRAAQLGEYSDGTMITLTGEKGQAVTLYGREEFLLARDERDGKSLAVVPEVIALMTEAGWPVANADLVTWARDAWVTAIALPAPAGFVAMPGAVAGYDRELARLGFAQRTGHGQAAGRSRRPRL